MDYRNSLLFETEPLNIDPDPMKNPRNPDSFGVFDMDWVLSMVYRPWSKRRIRPIVTLADTTPDTSIILEKGKYAGLKERIRQEKLRAKLNRQVDDVADLLSAWE